MSNFLNIFNRKSEEAISEACTALQQGGVLLHPTETCYGFAVDIFKEQALAKLYKIKQMSLDKPVSVMVADLQQAQSYGVFNETAMRLAQTFWPGALTIIVSRHDQKKILASVEKETSTSTPISPVAKSRGLPTFLNPGTKTIGFRCPDHAFTQKLLKTYGKPLSTTSANISGFPEAYDIQSYLQQLCTYYQVEKISDIEQEQLPDVIVDAGVLPKNPPSTIVDCSLQKPVIIRRGSLADEIERFLNCWKN